MDSLFVTPATSPDILTDKYRPRRIAEFVGLDKPRRIASRLAANPPLLRCVPVQFSTHGQSTETAALLERVWQAEAPAHAHAPNFVRIVKEACSNVRASLMQLQTELLLAE